MVPAKTWNQNGNLTPGTKLNLNGAKKHDVGKNGGTTILSAPKFSNTLNISKLYLGSIASDGPGTKKMMIHLSQNRFKVVFSMDTSHLYI